MAKKKVEQVEEVKVSERDLAIVKAINIMAEELYEELSSTHLDLTKYLEDIKKLLIEIRNGGVQW